MSDWTIGVVSPRSYSHSPVFNDVAFAFEGALNDLGHDAVCAVINEASNVDDDDRWLILGANLLPHHKVQVPADAILVNLEQHTSPWMVKPYLELLRKHEVWDYSQRNIDFLREFGIKAKLCRIGFRVVGQFEI